MVLYVTQNYSIIGFKINSTFVGAWGYSKMFLTNILLKKAKSKYIMVLMESAVSGHHQTRIRERLSDKLEYITFDPYIQTESLYKERRKIRSMKSTWQPRNPISTIGKIG